MLPHVYRARPRSLLQHLRQSHFGRWLRGYLLLMLHGLFLWVLLRTLWMKVVWGCRCRRLLIGSMGSMH